MTLSNRKITYSMQTIIHGKSLEEWDSLWTFVEYGFTKNHPNLNRRYGLFGAKLNGRFVYLGTGISIKGRGLNQALARIRTKNPSGDLGGIRALYGIVDDVEAYILPIDKVLVKNDAPAKILEGMISIHCPRHNASRESKINAIKQSYER